jgi:hypothetical protein
MRYIVSLSTLFAILVCPRALHAQGLTIDVNGVPGSGETTWTFSGSYTVGDVSQAADAYSITGEHMFGNNINNFQHESGNLSDGIGFIEIFNLNDFQFLSSTATVSGSLSGVHLLEAIFLDSDDPITGDDFLWYAGGTFQDGETLTFSGTATIGLDVTGTIALDMGWFLDFNNGQTSRSIFSFAGPSQNPADFTVNFTLESADDPRTQIEALEEAVEVLESAETISGGVATSLSAKLEHSKKHLEDQAQAAIGLLNAFIHPVSALVLSGRLSFEDGQDLVSAAQNVIADLTN